MNSFKFLSTTDIRVSHFPNKYELQIPDILQCFLDLDIIQVDGHVKIRHKNLNPGNRGWFKKCKPTHAFWWLPRLRPPAPFVCFSDKKHTSTSLIPPLIIISMHAGALGSLNENSSIYGTENSAFGLRRTRSSVKNNEQNSETPGLVHVSFRRRVLVFSFGHFFDR